MGQSLVKSVYINAPCFIKRQFANIEAIRRNLYRRYGNYNQMLDELDLESTLSKDNTPYQIKKMNQLLKEVKANVPYYKDLNIHEVNCLEDLNSIPILEKRYLMEDIDKFISYKISRKRLYKSVTSGSTGMPLHYYRDRRSIRYGYVVYDKWIKSIVGDLRQRKARFSGVIIKKFEEKKPPFWYLIDIYNQLQCSTYHLNENNFGEYLKGFEKYKIVYGTGYASAWYFLSEYMLKNNIEPYPLKTVILDSEGITLEEKKKIEEAFRCKVYQTYGLSETGNVAVECSEGHYHILTNVAIVEVVDQDGKPSKAGETGEILITDLNSMDAPFIRYKTGDIGILGEGECKCGYKGPYLSKIIGRIQDYILTKDGRKIGLLTRIIKVAKGVLASQIIQDSIDSIIIKIVVREDFDEKSMIEVKNEIKSYLGDMKVTYEIVDEIERTENGKIKHTIRNI